MKQLTNDVITPLNWGKRLKKCVTVWVFTRLTYA